MGDHVAANRPSRRRACVRPLGLIAVAVMAAGLGGCIGDLVGQSGPTAPERLDAAMGMDEHDVVRRWGPPDNSYEFADGGRSATWEYEEWNSLYEDYYGCEITLEFDPYGTAVDWSASYVPHHAQPCHTIMDGAA